MKKIILGIGFIIILSIFVGSYFLFGGFPVGYHNGRVVIFTHNIICNDVCNVTWFNGWYQKFGGNINESECYKIGGDTVYMPLEATPKPKYVACIPKGKKDFSLPDNFFIMNIDINE